MAKGGSRVCARRRSNLLSRKKVTKERPPYCPCPCAALRATCDARAGRGLAELALRAQTDASPDPPAAALLGTATRAQTSIRAIAALGPIKDIRVAVDRSCISRGRAQQRPVWFPALVDAPAAGCLRGGMRAGARMLRWQGLLTLCKGSRSSPEPVHQGARRSACVRTLKERNAEGRALVSFPSGCLAKGPSATLPALARHQPCCARAPCIQPLCGATRSPCTVSTGPRSPWLFERSCVAAK